MQKELSEKKEPVAAGVDFKLQFKDRVLEREVFNMNGLPGRVVHTPREENYNRRARSYDSHAANTTFVISMPAREQKLSNPKILAQMQKKDDLSKIQMGKFHD